MKRLPALIILFFIPAALCAAGFFDAGYINALYMDAAEQILSLDEERNLVYSPSAAALCGALLCVGASEEEASACAAAFGTERDVLIENSVKAAALLDKPVLRKQQVFFSGAFWHRQGTALSPAYEEALKGYFGAKALAFENGEELNKYWADTGFAPDPAPDAAALLTAAVSVTPLWETDPASQKVDFFRPYKGQARVLKFFGVTDKALYYETDNSFWISLPFAQNALRLDILCPDTRGRLLDAVKEFARNTDQARYATERTMTVYLPRTVIESREDPLERLSKKGLRSLGYSHILGKRPVPIEGFVCRSALTLEPAAEAETAEADEEITVNRPFLFAVRDEKYGLPLLAGVCAACK
ncbi:MAG: hypothetical protein IJT95_07005 [Abditibacteriota bacterium]|nr:hypothetical protein [Abditibacteriota bacterium]